MKKIIVLLMFLILFTGCKADYNLYIKSDGTISEEILAVNEETTDENIYKKIKSNFKKEYGSVLNKYNYNYDISYENNNVSLKITKNDNLNEYFKNSLYKEYFEDYELFNSVNTRVFKTIGSNYLNSVFIEKDYESEYLKRNIDELKINITFDNKVISQNADEYNDSTNTYTWIFNKNNLDKNIQFSYDTKEIVIDKKEKKVKKEKKKTSKKNLVILLSFPLTLLFGFVVILIINTKKNKL